MKCGWWDAESGETCSAEATHYSCGMDANGTDAAEYTNNACEKHKCRCKNPRRGMTIRRVTPDPRDQTIATLTAALERYAHTAAYEPAVPGLTETAPIMLDKGAHARAALAKIGGGR